MSKSNNIAVIGGDMRQVYMSNEFLEKGYNVTAYGLKCEQINNNIIIASSMKDAIQNSNILIYPIPFSKNNKDIAFLDLLEDKSIELLKSYLNKNHTIFAGLIPKSFIEYCKNSNIRCYDLIEMNDFSIYNAIATAEGAITEAVLKSPSNIHKSNCLILGYGRCAQILANKLAGWNANIDIAARKKDAIALAYANGYNGISFKDLDKMLLKYDFVFNTVPSMVLTRDKLEKLSPHVVIVDIASIPGGVDYTAANELNLNAGLSLGIPGKISPKTSGEIIINVIENIIFERSGDYET